MLTAPKFKAYVGHFSRWASKGHCFETCSNATIHCQWSSDQDKYCDEWKRKVNMKRGSGDSSHRMPPTDPAPETPNNDIYP